MLDHWIFLCVAVLFGVVSAIAGMTDLVQIAARRDNTSLLRPPHFLKPVLTLATTLLWSIWAQANGEVAVLVLCSINVVISGLIIAVYVHAKYWRQPAAPAED